MKSNLILIISVIVIFTTNVFGQEYNFGQPEHLLEGRSFNYQYQNQRAIHIQFKEGKVTYQWIKGPNVNNQIKTLLYLSRKLENGIYLVQWHEKEHSNFITLVFNFNTMTVASSVIVKYGLEGQFTTFDSGFISQLKIIN